MDASLRNKLLYVKSLKDIKAEVPGFKGELFPYQRVAIAFGVLARRVIIGDPCGAGKTIAAIGVDLKLRSLGEVRRTLVACLSDKRPEWVEEYKRFTDLPVCMVDGPQSMRQSQWMSSQTEAGVLVCSYEQLRADMVKKWKDDLGHPMVDLTALCSRMRFDILIFDEASHFKTPETLLADSLRAITLAAKPSAVLALTATPLEKNLTDVFSIMEKVEPSLFPDYTAFVNRYVIRKQFETSGRGGRRISFWKNVGYRNVNELSQLISPYWIARSREETLGTRVTQVRKIRYVTLSSKQQDQYDRIRDSVSNGYRRASMLDAYRQMEESVDGSFYQDTKSNDSSKLDDLMDLITGELAAEKLLVFSKRHLILDKLSERLTKVSIKFIWYTGREGVLERDKAKNDFNADPSIQVALVTTAAELGKNFHGAHYIVFLNHIMNPARINQLIGRIDRGVAQKSDFICSIHYAARGTFEEDIIPKLDKERELAKSVFPGTGGELVEILSDTKLYELIKHGKVALEEPSWMILTTMSEKS